MSSAPARLPLSWDEARSRMLERYIGRLVESSNPLAAGGDAVMEQVRAQFLAVVDEAIGDPGARDAPRLSSRIGEDRAARGVHPSQSLAAANLIFEAALPEVTEYFAAEQRDDPAHHAALRLNAVILSRMADAAAAYVEFLLEKAASAHRDEAKRLSRELHDAVGPSVAVGLQNFDLVEFYLQSDPVKAGERIRVGRESLLEAMTLVRDLAAETRLAIEPTHLAAALTQHLATVPGRIRTAVTNDADLGALSAHRANEIFLILREAVRNAVKHGNVTEITVDLHSSASAFVGAVINDGMGFDPSAVPSSGSGLASMRERAALLGAELSISSRPSQTQVRLTVPLPTRESP